MHAVIFDIDGTLLQSVAMDESLYALAIQSVLGNIHIRSSWDEYDHVTDAGILSQILNDNSLTGRSKDILLIERRFIANLKNHLLEHGPLLEVPGAGQFVRSIRNSKDHEVAIATGGWRSAATLKLESAGFDYQAVPIATCDDSPMRTQIMQAALSRIGSSFDSITYYGDGSWDQKACQELGWSFVAVGPALCGIESYAQTAI